MSGIVLSAAVRQNLLSLQNTAALLSTTQNRLASGLKVNSALDNPTNYFTAQGLNNRASDINNLLDGIGNGVQVLQAANTGLTSLENWSIPPSRSPPRCCRRPPAIRRSRRLLLRQPCLPARPRPIWLTVPRSKRRDPHHRRYGWRHGDQLHLRRHHIPHPAEHRFGSQQSHRQLDGSNDLILTTVNDVASSTIGAITLGSAGTATFGAPTAPTPIRTHRLRAPAW